ncbi:MAG: type II toxin-antitoxin system VapC family toxin [Terriglobales bacterium]
MSVRYLLDTDIASYIINDRFPKLREKLREVAMSDLSVSVITEAELRFGLVRRPELSHLGVIVEDFLSRVETLPWDSNAAKTYANLRADLEREGKLLGSMDMMIAAHALAAGRVLVTHDEGFRRVKKLRIEDWSR